MIQSDLHIHSHFSKCGIHSIMEIINHAAKMRLKSIAITDHGSALGGRLSNTFFQRFRNPNKRIKLFKGFEANILSEKGSIDCPSTILPFIDLFIVGFHSNTDSNLSKKEYTEILLNVMKRNPFIDILAHINVAKYPVDFNTITKFAYEKDIAIELNNSKYFESENDEQNIAELLNYCTKNHCMIVLNSDAHCLLEIGNVDRIIKLIQKQGCSENNIINLKQKRVESFIAAKRKLKNKYGQIFNKIYTKIDH